MVVKNVCELYVENSIKKPVSDDRQLIHTICIIESGELKNNDMTKADKPFICPKYISEAWIERFRTLEFVIDNEGYLYCPKAYNELWDIQTRALWLRSIGISPTKIAKRLDVKIDTLRRRWLITITEHYKLRGAIECDWANIGQIDPSKNRDVKFGGLVVNEGKNYGGLLDYGERPNTATYQKQSPGQLAMDTQLNMIRKKLKG